jgi:hypothetical protein
LPWIEARCIPMIPAAPMAKTVIAIMTSMAV